MLAVCGTLHAPRLISLFLAQPSCRLSAAVQCRHPRSGSSSAGRQRVSIRFVQHDVALDRPRLLSARLAFVRRHVLGMDTDRQAAHPSGSARSPRGQHAGRRSMVRAVQRSAGPGGQWRTVAQSDSRVPVHLLFTLYALPFVMMLYVRCSTCLKTSKDAEQPWSPSR